jgi:hypothetical protein
MKVLNCIIIGIVLFSGILIGAKFVKKDYATMREVVINKHSDLVSKFMKQKNADEIVLFASGYDLKTICNEISDKQTHVKMELNVTMSYPWNIVQKFLNMEQRIGSKLQEQLNTYKTELEKE